MQLYLARHGQTEANRLDKVLGRTDLPLNAEGQRQARDLGERLRGEGIDLAVTSPLARARQTCEIVCDALGISYEVCDELIEQDFGVFEGESRFDAVYLREKGRPFARFEGGESAFDLAARVYPLLGRLAAEHPHERVLMVTHNGINRVVHSYFFDMGTDEFLAFRLENCEVRRYEL